MSDQTSAQNRIAEQESAIKRDKRILEKLQEYDAATTHEQEVTAVIELLNLDKSQIVLKHLAKNASNQTAFGLALWWLNSGIVQLDWLYDVAYTVSTSNARQEEVDLKNLYTNAERLDLVDLAEILNYTENTLDAIKLDRLNIQELATNLEPEVVISLLTWFLSFKKIDTVDLNHITEIAGQLKQESLAGESDQPLSQEESLSHEQNVANPVEHHASEADVVELESKESAARLDNDEAETSSSSTEQSHTPEQPLTQSISLEDILLALNEKFGGVEPTLLTRAVDMLLFKQVDDQESEGEKAIFRSSLNVFQCAYDGKEKKDLPVEVTSSKHWPPGVYIVQKGLDEVRIVKFPEEEDFDLLEGSLDPYMRALTIWSTTEPNYGSSGETAP